MRKNKGFTLIELLAVIVILAIIAVITVPKVAEMIDTSRKGSAEDAFYGTIKAAELGWAKALQKDPATLGTTCTFENSGVSCTNAKVEIDTSGSNPISGKVVLDDTGAASVSEKKVTVAANGTVSYSDYTTAEKKANWLYLNGYYCYGDSTQVTCLRETDLAS